MDSLSEIHAKLDLILKEIAELKKMLTSINTQNSTKTTSERTDVKQLNTDLIATNLDDDDLPDLIPDEPLQVPAPVSVHPHSDLFGPNHPLFRDNITRPSVPFNLPPGARHDPLLPPGFPVLEQRVVDIHHRIPNQSPFSFESKFK